MAAVGDTRLRGRADLRVVFGGRPRADRDGESHRRSDAAAGLLESTTVRSKASRALPTLSAVLLGAAALLFGAVHPWAFWTVGVATVLIAVWTLSRAGIGSFCWGSMRPAALLLVPVLLQVVPIPRAGLESLAPATLTTVQSLEVGLDPAALHSVSVAPLLTAATLAFMLVGTFWVGAFARGLGSAFRVNEFVRVLMVVGVVIALFALVQKATFNGKIYWFWESQFGVSNNYFGPFVNRNHFAGWMLLATSLGAGHLLGFVSAAGHAVKPGWRHRVLWLGTPEASYVVLAAVGVAVMATSLVWSLSRSGVAGAFAAFLILAVAAVRRMRSRAQARMALLAILLLIVSVAAWRGLDTISAAYGDTRTLQWRFDLWRDSLPPLRAFYVLGSGLNTYGKVMLLYPQTDLEVHAQQAHNDYLQLAIEGGLLVAIPWLVALVILGRRIVRVFRMPQEDQTWWIRMGAVAGLCGIALQEVTEFSLQIPAVALLFATTLAIALHKSAPPPAGANRYSRSHHARS